MLLVNALQAQEIYLAVFDHRSSNNFPVGFYEWIKLQLLIADIILHQPLVTSVIWQCIPNTRDHSRGDVVKSLCPNTTPYASKRPHPK
jgi:hypothetical protein